MIVTLAGHVDHGKTSLVKALTGTDTDRLKEEKQRGLTIDLGFAYVDLDGQRLGFVDVPGHHRFVHNMVAGVAADQYALLIIAADDGPMPQTIEHLNILSLLGLQRGCLVLSKIDQATEEQLQATRQRIEMLVQNTFLADAALFEVSSLTGAGLNELKQHLHAAANEQLQLDTRASFRLAIDRSFTIKGSGLVVTGTVTSGSLNETTRLLASPGGESVRMRGLHVNNRPATAARVGDRCAINITGVSRNQIARGHWLLEDCAFFPVRRLLLALRWVSDDSVQNPRKRRSWRSLHIHHATTHTTGHVRLLQTEDLQADTHLAEILLDQPLSAKRGDRLIIRNAGAEVTLGGGSVIRIFEHRKPARRESRTRNLSAYLQPTATACLEQLMRSGGELELFRHTWNLPPAQLTSLLQKMNTRVVEHAQQKLAYTEDAFQALLNRVQENLAALHAREPQQQGLNLSELELSLGQVSSPPPGLLAAALTELVREGILALSNNQFHLTSHKPRTASIDPVLEEFTRLYEEVVQPPSLGDLAVALGIEQNALQKKLIGLANQRRLIKVTNHRFFLPQQIHSLAELALKLAQQKVNFTVRDYRDFTGLGRNVAIEVLEFFDRKGFTRRLDDRRSIIRDIRHVLD